MQPEQGACPKTDVMRNEKEQTFVTKTANHQVKNNNLFIFKNVESKSSQDRNKQKKSVNCEHFIFGLGQVGRNIKVGLFLS